MADYGRVQTQDSPKELPLLVQTQNQVDALCEQIASLRQRLAEKANEVLGAGPPTPEASGRTGAPTPVPNGSMAAVRDKIATAANLVTDCHSLAAKLEKI